MEITITALLLTKGNMNVYHHKKSSEKSELKVI